MIETQLVHIRSASEVLNNMLAEKFPTINDGYHILKALPKDLKKKIEDIADGYYKKLYTQEISDNFVRFWFEDERNIASEYFE